MLELLQAKLDKKPREPKLHLDQNEAVTGCWILPLHPLASGSCSVQGMPLEKLIRIWGLVRKSCAFYPALLLGKTLQVHFMSNHSLHPGKCAQTCLLSLGLGEWKWGWRCERLHGHNHTFEQGTGLVLLHFHAALGSAHRSVRESQVLLPVNRKSQFFFPSYWLILGELTNRKLT